MLQLLAADAAENGAAVIEEVRKTKPHVWLQCMVALCPRQLTVERHSPFSDISDEELRLMEELLTASRAKLVPSDTKQQGSLLSLLSNHQASDIARHYL